MKSPSPWWARRVRDISSESVSSSRRNSGESRMIETLDARYHQALRTNPSPIRRIFYAAFLARYGRTLASIRQFLVLLETVPEEDEMILAKVIDGVTHLDACLSPPETTRPWPPTMTTPAEQLLEEMNDRSDDEEGRGGKAVRRAPVAQSLDDFLQRQRRGYLTRQHINIARTLLRLARTCGQQHWVTTEVECLRRALRNYEIAVAGPESPESSLWPSSTRWSGDMPF